MKTPTVPEFTLRLPIAKVPHWADRYDYEDDTEVIAAGESARERGWYTRDEFLTITDWKTNRSQTRVRRNTAAAIEDATKLALATADERLRIGVLTLLQGVEMPAASVLPSSRPSGPVSHPRRAGYLEPRGEEAALVLLVRVLVGLHRDVPGAGEGG